MIADCHRMKSFIATAGGFMNFAPSGASESSPRRKPGVCGDIRTQPREGRKNLPPLTGLNMLGSSFPRLTPGATFWSPLAGLKSSTVVRICFTGMLPPAVVEFLMHETGHAARIA